MRGEYPHGSFQRFNQGCKCDPCRKAWNRYNAARMRDRRRGDWQGLVKADRARAHIQSLQVTAICMAKVAGLDVGVIKRIIHGHERIWSSTERTILSVTEEKIQKLYPLLANQGTFVDGKKARRMLADLKVSGFSQADLGREVGINQLRASRPKVRLWNAKRIERLYRETGVKRKDNVIARRKVAA